MSKFQEKQKAKTPITIKKNYRLYIEPKQVYGQYFYHGIEAEEELLEGILYFTNVSDHGKLTSEEVIEKAKNIYIQYFRFVKLNYENKIANYYRKGIEEEIEEEAKKRLERKIEQLSNETDDYEIITQKDRRKYADIENTNISIEEKYKIMVKRKEEETIKKKTQQTIRTEENYKKSKLNNDEKVKIEAEIRRDYLENKKIVVQDNKINYSVRERSRYIHFPEFSLEEDMKPYIIRNWTEDMYDILEYLEELEKIDKIEYYRIWLHTRIKRLENRKNGIIENSEEKSELEKEINILMKTKIKMDNIQERRER